MRVLTVSLFILGGVASADGIRDNLDVVVTLPGESPKEPDTIDVAAAVQVLTTPGDKWWCGDATSSEACYRSLRTCRYYQRARRGGAASS